VDSQIETPAGQPSSDRFSPPPEPDTATPEIDSKTVLAALASLIDERTSPERRDAFHSFAKAFLRRLSDEEIVTAGRSFIRCDDGKFHALVDGRRQYLHGYEQVAVGSTISVEVRSVHIEKNGSLAFDYVNRKTYEFKVVGRFTLPTRTLIWQDEMGNSMSEQLYCTTPQILIPQMTLAKIWREVSTIETPPITEIAIRVKNMAFLENNVADLAASLPEHTVMSVPTQVDDAAKRSLPEPVFRYPGPLPDPEEIRQAGTPMDLRSVTVMITYSISALLVASNMLVSLSQRRRARGSEWGSRWLTRP